MVEIGKLATEMDRLGVDSGRTTTTTAAPLGRRAVNPSAVDRRDTGRHGLIDARCAVAPSPAATGPDFAAATHVSRQHRSFAGVHEQVRQ